MSWSVGTGALWPPVEAHWLRCAAAVCTLLVAGLVVVSHGGPGMSIVIEAGAYDGGERPSASAEVRGAPISVRAETSATLSPADVSMPGGSTLAARGIDGSFVYGSKIARQKAGRGWDDALLDDALTNPVHVSRATNKATGLRQRRSSAPTGPLLFATTRQSRLSS